MALPVDRCHPTSRSGAAGASSPSPSHRCRRQHRRPTRGARHGIGTSEARRSGGVLRKLTRRGLRRCEAGESPMRMKHQGRRPKVLNATWQRCRVHFMPQCACSGRKSADVRVRLHATAFAQDSLRPRAAMANVADQIQAEGCRNSPRYGHAKECSSYMTFPRQHWTKCTPQNPLNVNGEIKRRTESSASFPTTMPS